MSAYQDAPALEARLQRIFLAQGIHAERGMVVRVGPEDPKFATDIDVFAVSFSHNFHRSVFHVECKSGKNAKLLDRVFWLAGVRSLLRADRSMLVVPRYDVESTEFARALGVETVDFHTVERLEEAYQVESDWWPGQSDFQRWDPVLLSRRKYQPSSLVDDPTATLVRDVYVTCKEEAWQRLSYGQLNRIIRHIGRISELARGQGEQSVVSDLLRLAVSYLLVRVCHVLLGICSDLLARRPLERSKYIANRLRFGDHDPDYGRRMVERSLGLARATVSQHGVELPARWAAESLLDPPKYHAAVVETVNRLMDRPTDGVYLPFSMELMQFGMPERSPASIQAWVEAGRPAAGLVKALLIQEFGVQATILEPPRPSSLIALLGTAKSDTERRAKQVSSGHPES